jgi:hypothetical protein
MFSFNLRIPELIASSIASVCRSRRGSGANVEKPVHFTSGYSRKSGVRLHKIIALGSNYKQEIYISIL